MITIGLTGGIASGKSAVAGMLQQFGAKRLDADVLGHQTYIKGTEPYKRILSLFGQDILSEDGEINRRVLGNKVFGNPTKMKQLTDVVWPYVGVLAKNEFARFKREGSKVVVLEAPVLIEAGWQNSVDRVWVTHVPTETAIARLMQRNLSRDEALKRINSQLTNEERLKHAHVSIDTNSPPEETLRRVKEIWNEFLQKEKIKI